MTRQKKELIKKITLIENFIMADNELGCGFAPNDFYKELEEESWNLFEELAILSHYSSATEMLNDDRYKRY